MAPKLNNSMKQQLKLLLAEEARLLTQLAKKAALLQEHEEPIKTNVDLLRVIQELTRRVNQLRRFLTEWS